MENKIWFVSQFVHTVNRLYTHTHIDRYRIN